jgi:hypothetical protein
MQGNSGIWIDHKEAFIVFAAAPDAEAKESVVDKHVRFSGHGSRHEGAAEDTLERHLAAERGKYYDEVIAHVSVAEAILLFGPGEAKGELEKRMVAKGLGKRIVVVETVDKMTDHQIVAKVRDHYKK